MEGRHGSLKAQASIPSRGPSQGGPIRPRRNWAAATVTRWMSSVCTTKTQGPNTTGQEWVVCEIAVQLQSLTRCRSLKRHHHHSYEAASYLSFDLAYHRVPQHALRIWDPCLFQKQFTKIKEWKIDKGLIIVWPPLMKACPPASITPEEKPCQMWLTHLDIMN